MASQESTAILRGTITNENLSWSARLHCGLSVQSNTFDNLLKDLVAELNFQHSVLRPDSWLRICLSAPPPSPGEPYFHKPLVIELTGPDADTFAKELVNWPPIAPPK